MRNNLSTYHDLLLLRDLGSYANVATAISSNGGVTSTLIGARFTNTTTSDVEEINADGTSTAI